MTVLARARGESNDRIKGSMYDVDDDKYDDKHDDKHDDKYDDEYDGLDTEMIVEAQTAAGSFRDPTREPATRYTASQKQLLKMRYDDAIADFKQFYPHIHM
jgi:hypothetical protein